MDSGRLESLSPSLWSRNTHPYGCVCRGEQWPKDKSKFWMQFFFFFVFPFFFYYDQQVFCALALGGKKPNWREEWKTKLKLDIVLNFQRCRANERTSELHSTMASRPASSAATLMFLEVSLRAFSALTSFRFQPNSLLPPTLGTKLKLETFCVCPEFGLKLSRATLP